MGCRENADPSNVGSINEWVRGWGLVTAHCPRAVAAVEYDDRALVRGRAFVDNPTDVFVRNRGVSRLGAWYGRRESQQQPVIMGIDQPVTYVVKDESVVGLLGCVP
ncbi:hypothetical protein GCM10009557_15410 [Virgisporangium ochraceum]|uniref:Uncharacterized protein n=1 Tax=Virgisporangium ochraceum TaxID=65505 RepID=A0A8J3ZT66_9ACTN|nr:hypothetical protein Voc01_028520 [Virgisporangium ochraceum]